MTTTSQKSVRLMTPGQFKTLTQIVTGKIPANMNFDEAEELIKRVGRATEEMFMDLRLEIGQDHANNMVSEMILHENMVWRSKWTTFYKNHFDLDLDFSKVVIPTRPTEGHWTLIIVFGLVANQIYHACQKLFSCGCFTENIDGDIKDEINGKATRPTGPYAVWVEAGDEAPEKYANKSADMLAAENHNGITLKERMLLEIAYFKETGQHLDINNITRCDGSSHTLGRVPSAHFDGRRFYVGWDFRGSQGDSLRSRAVSL